MGLFALGINHTTAPVAIRERVAFSPEQVMEALRLAVRDTVLDELVILSTCNRTELIGVVADEEEVGAEASALGWLAGYHHLAVDDLRACTYSYRGNPALQHVIEVACGLNSMVLGEPQILGQMKSAFAVAREAGTAPRALNRTMQYVFATAKQVRTQTAIGENPVSVAFAAVSLSQHIFSSLRSTVALLIGAGETIELVARHLQEQGVSRLIVANRTLERAQALAEHFRAEAILLSDIPEYLHHADIVISSTASQLPILGKGMVERALKKRKHRPIFMVDIAVPRDIEAEVGDLADVYLYTVDDLRDIIDENRKARESEATKASAIISTAVAAYAKQQRELDVVDTLRAYRQQAEVLRDDELGKALKQLENGLRPEEVVASLARSLTNKLIHTPCVQMKEAAAAGRSDVLEWTRQLLGVTAEAEWAGGTEETTKRNRD